MKPLQFSTRQKHCKNAVQIDLQAIWRESERHFGQSAFHTLYAQHARPKVDFDCIFTVFLAGRKLEGFGGPLRFAK